LKVRDIRAARLPEEVLVTANRAGVSDPDRVFVGRWWVVLAWIGPLAVLGYLRATGDFALGFDGATPTSFSTI
jgi:hypothetical protein